MIFQATPRWRSADARIHREPELRQPDRALALFLYTPDEAGPFASGTVERRLWRYFDAAEDAPIETELNAIDTAFAELI
jgi:hypothetical protein